MSYETVLVRPYCTLLDVQEVTGNHEPDEVEQTLRAINKASRLIEDMTDNVFWLVDHTENALVVKKDLVVGRTIFLAQPAISVSEITVDGEPIDLSGITLDGRYIRTGTEWPYPFNQTIRIKGTFGFVLSQDAGPGGETLPPTDLPASINRATTLAAAAISGQWHRERIGLDGSRDTMLETRIPGEVESLVRKWSRKHRLVGF